MLRVLPAISLLAWALVLTASHRDRRALVFPGGTVLQFSIGVSMPVRIPNRTFSISFGFQMVFNLPTNATQWRAPPEIRKREAFNQNLLETYLPLENFLEGHGFAGRECILRSICEAAQTPFRHEDMNLFDEIAHVLFTPSEDTYLDHDTCERNNSELYVTAECMGRAGADCSVQFPECPQSPLDFISETINMNYLQE
ncbi:hypothetical protein C0J52_05216 [Blattella germanica]|nr:hypothetical protein C0J52_05216 [Blattella germanica]